MAYFARGRKEDLLCLAEELGLKTNSEMKVADLKNLVINSDSYDEEFTKALLETIISTRKELEANNKESARQLAEAEKLRLESEAEKLKLENEAEKLRLENEARKQQLEFELRKLELTAHSNSSQPITIGNVASFSHELIRLMPKFKAKDDDIVLYLSLFERQAKRTKVDPKDWVSVLLTLLPSEIVQIIARESEEVFEDYDYIKNLLLKRFKLSPESFRRKFVQHPKGSEKSWRDFTFELTNYFQEWIDGLEIKDFESLKNLMITDQVKRRVPAEVREHFLDDWAKFVSPFELSDRLDEYDCTRSNQKKSVMKDKPVEKHYSKPPAVDRTNQNKFQHYSQSHQKLDQHHPKVFHRQSHRKSCFSCGEEGHFANLCPKNPKKSPKAAAQGNLVQAFLPEKEPSTSKDNKPIALTARITTRVTTGVDYEDIDKLKLVKIKCGTRALTGIIDSGAQISVVREELVSNIESEGEGKIEISSAFGESEITPLRNFKLKIDDGLHEEVPISCAVSKKLVSDLLLSMTAYEALNENIGLHNSELRVNHQEGCSSSANANETKDSRKSSNKIIPADLKICSMNVTSELQSSETLTKRNEFIKRQREDQTLKHAWELAEKGRNSFKIQDGLLIHTESMFGENVDQVVLPEGNRKEVLKMAHEIPLSGHLGEKKTKQRIKYSFFWPSIKQDIKEFCESCHVCQLRRPLTYRDRIPIQPIVRPETPFEVWSIDCIGPLEPPSKRGHKYIICAVDLCTRWAEATAVREISAKTTCNELIKIFTRTGFPKCICTDQGTNFTAKLTKAFLDLIGVAPRFSTPGHPESMGAVERWNRTLKDMLNKNIQEHGREWDQHLPFLLFAYREVPHSTTGMSPFQLVYGRLPQGPLSVLKDVWTGQRIIPTNASQSVETYLEHLLNRLQDAHQIAASKTEVSQENYASRYNLRSKTKSFDVGDKVLVLIPSSPHKLLNTWQPGTVVGLTRPHSARVEMENGSIRELHINKLRPYVARVSHIGIIFEQDEDFGEVHYAPADPIHKSVSEIWDHLKTMKGDVNDVQRRSLFKVLEKYKDVFTKKPGHAKVGGHDIKVTADCCPRRLKPYRVPLSLQEEVDRQIKELLEWDLIEPSDSEWAHPVVCVAKRDGSVRLCVDFRLLNSFTIPDAYPMKIAKDLLFEIGKARYITVLDLTKGYWQIPMKKEAKPYTAFVTHSGHYQWKVLPFGLKNAGSTFQKSMDKVLEPHKRYCRSYIDDLAIFSNTWEDHLSHIEQIFKTLRDVGLTANLEKCDFGKNHVKFLGHIIGSGTHSPDPDKIEVIRSLVKPTTKKEIRSLLGLASYYRDYIPNFSEIVLPLTNLTKKSVPQNVPWDAKADLSFNKLKEELVKMPSLHTPDINKPFQLYTDASAFAIGACLAQNDNHGKEMPIAFFSKKLTPCQQRWSTIEREAFCVIEALKKFDTWIFGAQVQIVSDHNPLTYLTHSVPHGAKLSRWALALQRYNMTVTYRKGTSHGNADALSRLSVASR